MNLLIYYHTILEVNVLRKNVTLDEVLSKEREYSFQISIFFNFRSQILRLNHKFLGRISAIYLKLNLPVGQVRMGLLITMTLDHIISISEVHSDLKQTLFST